jgi:hypothetical protein
MYAVAWYCGIMVLRQCGSLHREKKNYRKISIGTAIHIFWIASVFQISFSSFVRTQKDDPASLHL